MKIRYFLCLIFLSSCAYAKTMNPDEAQRYFYSLSLKEMREFVLEGTTQLCLRDVSDRKYCQCTSRKIVDKFKGDKIRDVLLPSSHRTYLSDIEYQQIMSSISIRDMASCM